MFSTKRLLWTGFATAIFMLCTSLFFFTTAQALDLDCPPECDPPPLPLLPTPPASLSLPYSPDANGAYSVSWGVAAGASVYYELDELWLYGINPTWSRKYTGPNRQKAFSGKLGGEYKYRVRACDSRNCSNWRESHSMYVLWVPTLSVLGQPYHDGKYHDANGEFDLKFSSLVPSKHPSPSTWQLVEGTSSPDVYTSNHTTVSKTGMAVGDYSYKVRACNGIGECTAYSTAQDVKVTTRVSVHRSYKDDPDARFTIATAYNSATGDQYYKPVYYWTPDPTATGPELVIFMNHGSGGVHSEDLPACGLDYLTGNNNTDWSGHPLYDGKCAIDASGNVTLADFETDFVPVGPDTAAFFLDEIIGKARFWAWTWRDAAAFIGNHDPAAKPRVHVFMIDRYTAVKDASHLDNALFWLQKTDASGVNQNTLPPYNFGDAGVGDIDNDDRPFHTRPEFSTFDNFFLYKHIKENMNITLNNNVMVMGWSNGASGLTALSVDWDYWTDDIQDYMYMQLNQFGGSNLQRTPGNPDLDPNRATVLSALNTAFSGAPYDDILFTHFAYGGCRLDGFFEKTSNPLPNGRPDALGRVAAGFTPALPMIYTFAGEDSLYTNNPATCNNRVTEGKANGSGQPFSPNAYGVATDNVSGHVIIDVDHGFDYKQTAYAETTYANERLVNTLLREAGLAPASYQFLPDLTVAPASTLTSADEVSKK